MCNIFALHADCNTFLHHANAILAIRLQQAQSGVMPTKSLQLVTDDVNPEVVGAILALRRVTPADGGESVRWNFPVLC